MSRDADGSTPALTPPEPTPPEPAPRREIRSFVLRQGRTSPAQTRAVETLLPRFGIPFQAQLVDLDREFGRVAPKILEIGFGMGETTAAIAEAQPDRDFLGIEVHTPGIGALLRKIDERGLSNVRIVQHDAVEVVRAMIAPASLDGIHVFFPDPWPKKRHHKRRLIQPAFVGLLASCLRSGEGGGYIHLATDWEEYAQQMLEVLSGDSQLHNTAEAFAPKPDYRPLTKFEQRGLKLGHGVWDLVFRRAG